MELQKYQEIDGNLISLALRGEFDVIAHGCNCQCQMGAGIAPQMAKTFGADKFYYESQEFVGDIHKLGQIDYEKKYVNKGEAKHFPLIVVNAYTQFGFGRNHKEGSSVPLDYGALTLCMRKMNRQFRGMHIGLPKIGCGLAGGIWDIEELPTWEQRSAAYNAGFRDVKTIIQEELKDCFVTIVNYKP